MLSVITTCVALPAVTVNVEDLPCGIVAGLATMVMTGARPGAKPRHPVKLAIAAIASNRVNHKFARSFRIMLISVLFFRAKRSTFRQLQWDPEIRANCPQKRCPRQLEGCRRRC